MSVADDGPERGGLTKAGWRLLPLLALGYGVSFMDRVNIGFAALQMNRDLHFSASTYGLGAGLFFLSYALFEIPSNLILVRVGPRRWLSRIMLTWGVLATGMMFVRTPPQFYAMRLLLGFAEAGFFPGVVYYVTQWFPASHRGRAISWFYVAAPISTVFMGALAGTLLGLQGRFGLAGWQWLFLVEGLPAVALSILFLCLMPDSPASAAWLTASERGWLQDRLAADAAPAGDARPGLLGVLANPRVLALGGANFVILGGYYCFNLSAPSFLRSEAQLRPAAVGWLVATGGLLAAAAMLGWARSSDLARERFVHLAAPMILMAVAFAALSWPLAPVAVMIAYVSAVILNGALGGVFWPTPGELLDPRAASVGVAAINAIGQVGSFVAPVLWGMAKDRTGDYRLGLRVLPFAFLIGAILVLWLRTHVRARDRAAA